jgi:hypothetical protein
VFLSTAAPAAAQTRYTSRADFMAALTTPATVVGFSGIAPRGRFVTISSLGPLTFGGVGAAQVYSSGYDPPITIGSGDALVTWGGPVRVTIPFPLYAVGVTAGSHQFSPSSGSSAGLGIVGQGFISNEWPTGEGPVAFLGLVSATPFTQFSLSGSLGVAFDDLTFATVSGVAFVPEPPTLGLLGAALGALGGLAAARRGRGRRGTV